MEHYHSRLMAVPTKKHHFAKMHPLKKDEDILPKPEIHVITEMTVTFEDVMENNSTPKAWATVTTNEEKVGTSISLIAKASVANRAVVAPGATDNEVGDSAELRKELVVNSKYPTESSPILPAAASGFEDNVESPVF